MGILNRMQEALLNKIYGTPQQPEAIPFTPQDPNRIIPMYISRQNVNGLLTPGNVDLTKQPVTYNPETKGYSTVYSEGQDFDGKHMLLPRITPDGRYLESGKPTADEYFRTGKNLGTFASDADANTYGTQLHQDYENHRIRGYEKKSK